ncbi:hypothetical protein KJ853_03695 [Patescibacteria group bacterium]|nr:hypothetical protein [Patescibacteria group bacterium]
MITEKEKIAIQIIYREYKKDKSPEKIYMETNELLKKSGGGLSLPDLHALILHGNSQYIGFLDVAGNKVKLNPVGIAYMEAKLKRILTTIAFWVFGVAAIIAVTFAALTYYYK